MSFHDARLGPLVDVPEGEEYEGKVDEGEREERLDYGSSSEWEAPKGGTLRTQLRFEVHVVQDEATSSNELHFLILHLF